MLNISTKEFDLNTLFSFESLKQILLELAKSQIKLENSIKNIQQENKERDKKIISLIKQINNNDGGQVEIDFNNTENIDLDFDNNFEEEILNEQKDKKEEKKENMENNQEIKYNINNNNEQILIEQKSEEYNVINDQLKENITKNKETIDQEEKLKLESNINLNTNSNIVQEQIFIKTKPEIVENQNQFQSIPMSNNIYNTIKNDDNNNKISPSLIKNIMKQIKDQKSRIVKLEENVRNVKEEETKITNMALENKSEYNLTQDKINSLIQKNQEIEQVIEKIQIDLKGLDIMRMFQDDGSGNIDATKVLVKALQDKVFKKFELLDERYKKDGIENAKTKSTVDNLVPKIDLMKNNLEKINEYNRKNKDEFDDYVKNNENIRNELKENIYNDINKNISNLKEAQNNKNESIEEKINNLNNLINKIQPDSFDKDKEKSSQKEQSEQIELENLKNIDNKFIDLSKKISLVDNTIKSHLKSPDIETIKKDITEIKLLLNTKIAKEDLTKIQKEIITNYNDINDIKDKSYYIEDEVKKMRNENCSMLQKIESFQGNLISMQAIISSQDSSKNVLDYSKYIDQNKLKEMFNPIMKEIENINKEVYSNKREIIEGDENTKRTIKNIISKLDEENKNLINELKTFVQKKYLDKIEYNKTMKKFAIQMKYLTDEKKKDSESWLLGKRNIQCFNCASCEKNINNENHSTAEYLAWKKYQKGEKIHRMGQGFSHMLEMISEDFAKNIDKNEIFNDETNNLNSDNNNNMYTNTLPNKDRANSMRIKRIKKGESSLKNLKIQKNLAKMKLPKMFTFKKYEIDGNHISDEENRNFDDKIETENIEGNPRIMKIFKKGFKNEIDTYDNFKTINIDKEKVNK